MLNRRGFLKRAANMVGAAVLGARIIPTITKANELEKVDIPAFSQVIDEDATGGYYLPSHYGKEIALQIDKEAFSGTRYIQPILHSSGEVTVRAFNSLNG